jgi:pimeloyl-ACP methyl ester carboxylesterase
MSYTIKEEAGFKYVEVGRSQHKLVLLHGLFGALSNFTDLVKDLSHNYCVIVPILPITEMPAREISLEALTAYVHGFLEFRKYGKVHLLGNSLGGHIALLYTLAYPENVTSLILTGSSGLFESGMGTSYPKRGDYEFIKTRTEYTFHDPKHATKELVDEVFDIVNDRAKAINIIAISKSAIRHNLATRLHEIKCPTLLIWGNQDIITPAFVGDDFHKAIEGSELHFIDECGHAPMMEQPKQFNYILERFLERVWALDIRSIWG